MKFCRIACLVLVGLLFSWNYGYAQNTDYFEMAHTFFMNGEYEKAENALGTYVDIKKANGQELEANAQALETKIKQCLRYLERAETAKNEGLFDHAIDYYNHILEINPNDHAVLNMKKQLASERRPSQSETTIKETKEKKNPLKPFGNNFQIRYLSSFSSKGKVGFGFYGNKSFFQIGFDFIWADESREDGLRTMTYPEDGNYWHLINKTENLYTNGMIKERTSEYAHPRFLLSVSPGINLNYFSIECGIGTVLCENAKYTIDSKTSDCTVGNKAYFSMRPTLVGYLPLGSGRSGGLLFSVGYNFVPNAKALNSYIFGVGLFMRIR